MTPADGPTLGAFVLLALAGAPHCAGMCGGLALAAELPREGGGAPRPWLDRTAFLTGKAFTYAVLGLALSLGTEQLLPGPGLERLRGILAWCAGGALVFAGLVAVGALHPVGRGLPPWLGFVTRGLGAARRSVRTLPGPVAPLGAGLLTGLLPCGISWSAFLLAAASTPGTAALGLVLFGMATGPALIGAAFSARRLAGPLRRHARLAAGIVLIVMGVFTAWRGGIPGVPVGASGQAPPCCEE